MAFTIRLWPHSIFPFASGLYAVVRDNFTSNWSNSSSASSASSSPRSTTIFPMHPYRHMTSSIKNLHIAAVVLFVSARPSTWFVRSSLASTRYRFWPSPIGIVTKSTIHLKCTACGYVGCNSSSCQTTECIWQLSQVKSHTLLYIPDHQYFSFSFSNVAHVPRCPDQGLSWNSDISLPRSSARCRVTTRVRGETRRDHGGLGPKTR